MNEEKIPRTKDPRQIRKMMNHNAYRFESMDDLWHAAAVAFATTWWNGVPAFQNQFDLRRYFDLVDEQKFDIVIETGVYCGGSALFFMDILDILGQHDTPYIGIDLDLARVPQHVFEHSHNHAWIQKDCLDLDTINTIKQYVEGKKSLIILDSVHTEVHVREELRLYAPLSTPGSYLVVSDADHNGHPVLADYGPSAWEATRDFLITDLGKSFIPDKEIELRYGKFTVSPDAWLRRI